jgi:Bacterial extracellular solute-binding proteins, family 3
MMTDSSEERIRQRSNTAKKIKSLIIYSILGIIFFSLVHIFFEQYQLPNPIVIGIRTSATPLGYDVEDKNAKGFCGVFGRELKKTLNKPIKLFKTEIEYLIIQNDYLPPGYDRYDGLKQGTIHVECGANSLESGNLRNSNKEQFKTYIKFSKPFYTAGIKLLLHQNLFDKLIVKSSENKSLQELLSEVNVGVWKTSSTFTTLKRYNFNPKDYPDRQKALKALDNNKESVAYASDDIILMTLFKEGQLRQYKKDGTTLKNDKEPYETKQYKFYPKKGYLTGDFSTEKYVLAASKDKPYSENLMSSINDILTNNSQIAKAKENLKKYVKEGILDADPVERQIFVFGGVEIDENVFIFATIFVVFILALLAFIKNKNGVKGGIHINSIYNVIRSQIAAMGDSAQAKGNEFSRKNQNSNDDKKDS